MRVFVDSSAWIAVAIPQDGRHAEATKLLREAVRRKVALFTTNLIVAEVHRLLLYRSGSHTAAVALDRIDRSPLTEIVFPTAAHHDAARAWLAKLADQRITYTDAVSFAVMDAARCRSAMAYDRHFATAGFGLWRPT